MLEEQKVRDPRPQGSAGSAKPPKTKDAQNSDVCKLDKTAKRIQTINPSRRLSSLSEHCAPCPPPGPLPGPLLGGLPGSSLLFGQQAAALRLAQLKTQIALTQISNTLSFGGRGATFSPNSNKSVPYISSTPPSPTAAAISLLNHLKIANTMSRQLYNPYASGNQSSSQGQYGLSSTQSEKDSQRLPSYPGSSSSFSSSGAFSGIPDNSERKIPPLMPQLRNYRPVQSRSTVDEDIASSVDMHVSRAREEVRLLGRSGHRSVDQDNRFSSSQREVFCSSDTRMASHSMSSAHQGQRHNLDAQDSSSSLDWISSYKRPISDDSKFYSPPASSSRASSDDSRFNPHMERRHDSQAIPGLGDYDKPASSGPSRPKYTSEVAANILLHFGLEKEDLEQLISYPEDQITPANLPFILREIRLQKDKRMTTAAQSDPFPEPLPSRTVDDSYGLSRFGGEAMQQEKTSSSLLQSSKVIDYGHTGKYTAGSDDVMGRKSDRDIDRTVNMFAMDNTSSRHNLEPLQKSEWKSSAMSSSLDPPSSFPGLSSSSSSGLSSTPAASSDQTKQSTQPNQILQSIFGLLSKAEKRGHKPEAPKPFPLKEAESDHQSTSTTRPPSALFYGNNPTHPGHALSSRIEASGNQDLSKTKGKGSVVIEHIIRQQTKQKEPTPTLQTQKQQLHPAQREQIQQTQTLQTQKQQLHPTQREQIQQTQTLQTQKQQLHPTQRERTLQTQTLQTQKQQLHPTQREQIQQTQTLQTAKQQLHQTQREQIQQAQTLQTQKQQLHPTQRERTLQTQTLQTQKQQIQPTQREQNQQTQKQQVQQVKQKEQQQMQNHPLQKQQEQQTPKQAQTQKQKIQINLTYKQQVKQTPKPQPQTMQPAPQMAPTMWPQPFSPEKPFAPVPLMSLIPGSPHSSVTPTVPPQPVMGLPSYNPLGMMTSNVQPPSKFSKAPPEAMINDYAATPPKAFPHTCTLCNRTCTDMQDWISHQNTGPHLQNCKKLCIKYPEWADEIDGKSRQECSSKSKSPSPRRHRSSEGRRTKRRSRSRSPQRSRRRRRSPSWSPSRSRSRSFSPKYERRVTSSYRSRSRSHERRSPPRRSDRRGSTPKRRERRGSTPKRRDRRGSTPKRRDRRGSTPKRRDRRGSTPKRRDSRGSSPRRKRERAASTEDSSPEREKQERATSAERLAKKILETSALQSLSGQSDLETVVKTLAPALVAELAKIKSSSSSDQGRKRSSSPSAEGKRSSSSVSSASAAKKESTKSVKGKPGPAQTESAKASPATMVKLRGINKCHSHSDVLSAVEQFGKSKSLVLFRAKLEAVVIFEKEEDATKLKSTRFLEINGMKVAALSEKDAISKETKTPPKKNSDTSSASTSESSNEKTVASSTTTSEGVKTVTEEKVTTSETKNIPKEQTTKPLKTGPKPVEVKTSTSAGSKSGSDAEESKQKPKAAPQESAVGLDKKPTGGTVLKETVKGTPPKAVAPSGKEKPKTEAGESLVVEKTKETTIEPQNKANAEKELGESGPQVKKPVEVGIGTRDKVPDAGKSQPQTSSVETRSTETTIKASTEVQKAVDTPPTSGVVTSEKEQGSAVVPSAPNGASLTSGETIQQQVKISCPSEETSPKVCIEMAEPSGVTKVLETQNTREKMHLLGEALCSETVETGLPASESQSSNPPATPLESVSQTSPSDGTTISEPIAAELSFISTSNEAKTKEVQKPAPEIKMEEETPTSSLGAISPSPVSSLSVVPTSSSPAPEEDLEELQIDKEILQALTAVVRQHRLDLAKKSRSKEDKSLDESSRSPQTAKAEVASEKWGRDDLREDSSVKRSRFDEQALNFEDFVTVDEVGDDTDDPNPQPHRSTSSRHSSKETKEKQSAGSRRISTRSSKDSKSSSSSSSSASKSRSSNSASPKKSKDSSDHNKASSSSPAVSTETLSSPDKKSKQSRTKSPIKASNTASSRRTRSSAAAQEKEKSTAAVEKSSESLPVQLQEEAKDTEGAVTKSAHKVSAGGTAAKSVESETKIETSGEMRRKKDEGKNDVQQTEEQMDDEDQENGSKSQLSGPNGSQTVQETNGSLSGQEVTGQDENPEVDESAQGDGEETKDKMLSTESSEISKEAENPESQINTNDSEGSRSDVTEQPAFEILDSVDDQTATEDEAPGDKILKEEEDSFQVIDSVEEPLTRTETESETSKSREDGRPSRRSGHTSRTSKSEEKEKSPENQVKISETQVKTDAPVEKELTEEAKFEIVDSVEDASTQDASEQSGRRRSTRGKKEDKVTEAAKKPDEDEEATFQILDSVEDDEATVPKRGRRERSKVDTPTRRRQTPVRESRSKENTESSPIKKSVVGELNEEVANCEILDSVVQVVKDDPPAPRGRGKRGRPKKQDGTTSKKTTQSTIVKEEEEKTYQVVDPVEDESSNNQPPAEQTGTTKSPDKQEQSGTSLEEPTRNENEEKEPLYQIVDSVEEVQEEPTAEEGFKTSQTEDDSPRNESPLQRVDDLKEADDNLCVPEETDSANIKKEETSPIKTRSDAVIPEKEMKPLEKEETQSPLVNLEEVSDEEEDYPDDTAEEEELRKRQAAIKEKQLTKVQEAESTSEKEHRRGRGGKGRSREKKDEDVIDAQELVTLDEVGADDVTEGEARGDQDWDGKIKDLVTLDEFVEETETKQVEQNVEEEEQPPNTSDQKISATSDEAGNDGEKTEAEQTSKPAKRKHDDDTEESMNFVTVDEVGEEEEKEVVVPRKRGRPKKTRNTPVRKSTRGKNASSQEEDELPPSSLEASSTLKNKPNEPSNESKQEVKKSEEVETISKELEKKPPEEETRKADIKVLSKVRRELDGPAAKRSRSQSPSVTVDFKLPAFKPNNPLGQEFVVPKSGFFCNLCCVFYHNESTAKEQHCSSQKHYDNLKKHYEKLQQKSARDASQCSAGSVSD